MVVKIKDKEVTLKYGFKALMIYEEIAGKSFAPHSLTEIITFMASVILASDKEIAITIDDLIELLDEQPQLLMDFTNWLGDVMARQEALAGDTETVKEEEPKKKKGKKEKNC